MNRRRFLTSTLPKVAHAEPGFSMPPRAAAAGDERIQKALLERKGSLKGLPEPIALPRRTSSGLGPYTPSPSEPWNRRRAMYLLRRTCFGATKEDVDRAMSLTPDAAVDELLKQTQPPDPPGSWVNENYVYNRNDDNDADNRQWLSDLRQWWMKEILTGRFSIREKMVWFWHDHWSTEASDVPQPHFNYWLLDNFRRNYLGNFRQMLLEVTLSPAMLIYLDGRYNTRSRPNENYARELMELHTLGEGIGYTEDDVKAAARGLTGWTLKTMGPLPSGKQQYHPYEAAFVSNNHDAGEKTFMGRSGNWKHGDIIDLILDERRTEVSTFICRKLYRQFVYEIADEAIVSQLARVLVSSNWELRPVVATLLKSAHFFYEVNIGAHITSPLEYYAGAVGTLEINPTNMLDVYNVCATLGLQLLQPPNVKGWPEYRTWISASRLSSRWSACDTMVDDSKKSKPKYPFDPVAFVTKITDPADPRRITQDLIELFCDLPLNEYQTNILFEKLLNGWRDYEWDITNPGAADRIRGLLKAILRSNEAELV